MSDRTYERPEWMDGLAGRWPEVASLIEDTKGLYDVKSLVAHLGSLRGDEMSPEWTFLFDFLEQAWYEVERLEYIARDPERASLWRGFALRLSQALDDCRLAPPPDLFQPRIARGAPKDESDYAWRCACSFAAYARNAVRREERLRMASEMPRFAKGVEAAARLFSKPFGAQVWIEVLHPLASTEMDDAFVVVARELAGLGTPASAHPEIRKSIADAREILGRHGILRDHGRKWTPETVLLEDTKAYLAGAGRSLDSWIMARGDDGKGFSLEILPSGIVLAELHAWELVENPFLPSRGRRRIRLTPAGRDAAFHHAIVERDGSERRE